MAMTSRTSATIAPACPDGLKIEQVQVLVRHGERSPITPRFQNTGLSPYWPYCSAARRFSQIVMASQNGSGWETMTWKRCLETSGPGGRSIPARSAGGETDGICMPGELTDRGRETSLAFGKWLRSLYVDQLSLLPEHLLDANVLYVRATEVPRVVESTQQIIQGLYPKGTNRKLAPWEIVMRSRAEETLIPNTKSCARLAELVGAFSQEAAEKWNGSNDMRYLSKKLGKWMPGNKALALDSRPSLLAVMDSINATAAHGPNTRLPDEFYDERVRKTIERILIDQMFRGYSISRELRMLGAGQLVGDIVLKMVDQVEWDKAPNKLRDLTVHSNTPPKLSIIGCHDRTIGTVLSSLGCLDSNERWPPFTGHVIFELFRKRQMPHLNINESDTTTNLTSTTNRGNTSELQRIGGRPTKIPAIKEVGDVHEYFVRIRYNDRIMRVPGCQAEGKHFNGDSNLCTLAAFKSVVDKFTPKNWKRACNSNLGDSATRYNEQAGY
ncbi:histidine phosphatase superfamily [Xylaria scruposa]|nr:histidine phosphatase superfamily [Xylaria scruposa]